MSVPSSSKEICTLEHGGNVYQVAIANDNMHAFTAGADGVKVWDTNSPKAPLAHIDPLVEDDKSTHTWAMKLFPHSGTLAVGGWRENVFLVDINSASPTVTSSLNTSAMACISLAFSPDGGTLYTGHNNGKVCVWDWKNQTLLSTLEGHSGYCNCLALSPDGGKLWSGGDDKTVRLWDLKEGKEVKKKVMERGVNCHSWSPTQQWVVAGMDNSNLSIFTEEGEDKHKLELDSWRINSVKFSSSGSWFSATTEKGVLRGFTTPSGPSIFNVEGRQDTTSSCDISRDDSHIITGLFGTFGNKARFYQLE